MQSIHADFSAMELQQGTSESERKHFIEDPNATVMTSPQDGRLVANPAEAMPLHAAAAPAASDLSPRSPASQGGDGQSDNGTGVGGWLHHVFASDEGKPPPASARRAPADNPQSQNMRSGSPVDFVSVANPAGMSYAPKDIALHEPETPSDMRKNFASVAEPESIPNMPAHIAPAAPEAPVASGALPDIAPREPEAPSEARRNFAALPESEAIADAPAHTASASPAAMPDNVVHEPEMVPAVQVTASEPVTAPPAPEKTVSAPEPAVASDSPPDLVPAPEPVIMSNVTPNSSLDFPPPPKPAAAGAKADYTVVHEEPVAASAAPRIPVNADPVPEPVILTPPVLAAPASLAHAQRPAASARLPDTAALATQDPQPINLVQPSSGADASADYLDNSRYVDQRPRYRY
jgi:hypothetical protein